MKLVMILMAVVQAECVAVVQEDFIPDGDGISGFDNFDADSQGLRDNRAEYAVERLEEMRDELAEARTDFRFQTNVLKNVVAEVNDLKALYESHSQGPRIDVEGAGDTSEELVVDDVASDDPAVLYQDVAERSNHLAEAAESYEDDEVLSKERKSPSFLGAKNHRKNNALGNTVADRNKYMQGSNGGRVFLQLIFGIFYYFLVVQKYPRLDPSRSAPSAAVELQKLNPVKATFLASPKNCLLSFLCPGPRAAHTYESAGVMNYWFGLCCMSCFPCCTLFATNTFSDLNVRLGGEPMGLLPGCLSAMFCCCCLITQDAESLDIVTGMKVEEAREHLAQHAGPQRMCC